MKRIIVWITVLSLILVGVFTMNACTNRTDENGVEYQLNTPAKDDLGRVIITYGEQPEDYLGRMNITKTENGVPSTVPVEASMLVTTIDTSVVDGSGQILQFTYAGQMFSVPVVVKYKVEFVVDGNTYRSYYVHNKAGLDNIKGLLEEEAKEASGLGDAFDPDNLKLHELLVAPAKDGYSFKGWIEDGVDASEKAEIAESFPGVIKNNITFTAVYEPAMDEIPALSVIYAIYGEQLANVELPGNAIGAWQFVNAEESVGDIGEHVVAVQFVELATGNVLKEDTVIVRVVKKDAPELPELPVINAVYGDLLADVELPSFESGKWQFVDAEGTVGNVGEKTFAVQFVEAETNEVLEERTITVLVAKKTVNFSNVVESFIYNGKYQLPTFQTDAPDLNVENILFNGDETLNYTDVGSYNYSFVVVDENHEGTLEGTFEIQSAVIEITLTLDKNLVYVGDAAPQVTYEISVPDGMNAADFEQFISVVVPEVENVGEYTVTATTFNQNINLVATPVTFTVAKRTLNVGAPTISNEDSVRYGDTLADVYLDYTPYGFWEWANPTDLVGEAGTVTHLAIFTPTADHKYEQEYYWVEFNVNKVKIEITVTENVFNYDGQEHSISYIVKDEDGNEYTNLTVLGNVSYTDAGRYIVNLTLDEKNYYIENGAVGTVLEIKKINSYIDVDTNITTTWKPGLTLSQIALPTAPNGYFVWGTAVYNVDSEKYESNTEYANAVRNAAYEVQLFNATFVPYDQVNYELDYDVVFQVTINKATPVIEGIENNYAFTYNGSIQGILAATVNPDKYGDDTVVFEYTYEDGTPFTGVTEAGVYTVIVTLCESANNASAQLTVTVTVAKADPEKPTQLQSADIYYGDLAKDKIKLPTHAQGVWSLKDVDDTTTVGTVGRHTFVAVFTPTTGNYNAIEVPITVEVAKKYINVPQISELNQNQVYTGALLTSGLVSAEGYTVIDNGGINVGTYTVQIILDTAGYEWSAFGTASTFELQYNIVRADNAWDVEPTIKSEWTYGDTDGLSEDALAEYKGIASAVYGNVVVLYAPQGTEAFSDVFPTNAGAYTVKFIVTDSNYNDLVKTIDFIIYKKVVNVPAYTQTYLYTGSDITVDIPASDLYTVAGNVAKNAGAFEAVLTLVDSVNYKWNISESDSVALAYEIIPSGVALSITVNGWTFGQAANLPVVGIDKSFSDDVTYVVDYSEDGVAWSTVVPVEAGSYIARVRVEGTANYNAAEASCNFTIEKAAVTIDGANDAYSKNYDGNAFTLTGITASNGAAIRTVITKNGEVVNAIVNAGEYVITYSVAESANYFAATRTVNVTVEKADVTISAPVIEGWTYGESAKAPGAGFNEIFAQISNNEITFKYFTDAECTDEIETLVNAGTYYVKAIFAGNDNLNACESEAVAFVIAKLAVNVPTVSNKEYNGAQQTSGLVDSTEYTVVDLGGINVGTYTAVVTLVSDNYIWADGTSEAKELAYQITPIANTETFDSLEYTATYGDLLKDIITLPAGVEGTWSIEGATDATTVGNAGINTFKAIFTPDEAGNYVAREVEITVTVAKATVTVPTEYTTEYVYTGSNITAVIPTSALYTITNNVAKNVGGYNATLTLTDSANYVWSNGDTLVTTVPYSITKASVTISDLALEGWTYGQVANVPTITINKNFADDVTVYFEYSVDGASWSKTVPATAGTYQVRAIVDDTVNYFGYTSESYSFNVAKAAASINGVNAGDVLTQVYNGSAYVFSSDIKASHNESALQFAITYNGVAIDAIVNAGEYTVVITLAESDNYNEASVEFTVAIAKAENNDSVSTEQNATYGDAISNIVLPTSAIGTWTIKEAVTTVGNAGVNTFTALFTPSTENYNSREVTITVTVAKAVVEKPIINPVEYTGEKLYSGLVSNELYTVVDNGGIDHGEYDVVLTLVDANNYKWDTVEDASIIVKFVISTAINKWVEGPIISTWEYESEGDHAGKAEAMYGGVLVEYKPVGAPDSEYSTTLPTVPGDYVARFTTTDDNYIILTETKNFSITKRKITPPTQAQTEFIYTGSLITSGLTDGIGYAVVADEGRINVGSFTATVTLTSEYYVWADGTSADKTFTYSITPATNTEEITLAYNAIYGDLLKDVITLPAGVQGTWSIEGATDATTVGNAGTRTFKLVFIPDEVGNYNRREETVTVTVAKASVTPPTVTAQEGVEYTGNKVASGVPSTDLYTVTDLGGVVVGTHKVQLTLTDKSNYQWQDGDSEDIYFDYVTIVKAQNRDEIPTYTATYGDSLATLTLPTSATGSWKWQTITEVGTVGGENKHVLVFTPADAANYEDRTVEVSITVNPKKISVPAISETKLNQVYTGEALFSGLMNGEGYTVVDNGGINVGTYTAVVTLANANYIWADETSADKELAYNIVPANNTEDITQNYTATYGDLLKDIITLPAGVQGTWSIEGATDATTVGNAGTRTFKAIFTPDEAGNYNAREVVITVTVGKKAITAPTEYTQEYTYTGSDITAIIPTSDLYTITGNVAKNVGSYNAVLTLTDSANYKWETTDATTITVPYSIIKATVTLKDLVLNGWTYGEAANEPTVTIEKNFEDSVTVSFEYLVNGEWVATAPRTAGTYKVKAVVEGAGNYDDAELIAEFTIARASVTISGVEESYSKMYDGNAFVIPSATASNGATVTKVITKAGETVDAIVSVGEYVITYSVAESANYSAATATVTVTVEKANVTISAPVIEGWTYNEAVKAPSAAFNEAFAQISNSEITFKYYTDAECTNEITNLEGVDAGTYYVKAFFAGNDSLNATEGEAVAFAIAKKVIAAPTASDKVYNGEQQNGGIVENAGYTVVDNGGINVGAYTAVVTLANANYVWEDGTTEAKELTYAITKATLSLKDLAITGWISGQYDATLNMPTVTVVGFEGDIEIIFEYNVDGVWGTTLPTRAGEYAVRAIIAETDNYGSAESIGLRFQITTAEVALPTINTEYPYTGSAQKPTIADSVYYTVVGNDEHVAMGEYTITLVPKTEYSFVWAGETDEPTEKTLTYRIGKGSVTLSGLTINNWSYKGTASTPTVNVTTSFGGDVTVRYEYYAADGTLLDAVPTAVGTYKLKAIVDGTENYNGAEAEKTFEITKASATWDAPTFTGGVNNKFYMNQFGYSTNGLTATYEGETIPGTFAFSAPVFVEGENASYIELTFTPVEAENYAKVVVRYNLTFVVVATNTTTGVSYTTIEAALAAASSGNTVQVKPYDKDLGPIYIMEDVTIPNGVTLILPYGVNGDGVNTIGSDGTINVPSESESAYGNPADESLCHVVVAIAAGKKITNNGILQIAGQLSGGGGASPYAGFTALQHARLYLDDGAELINNGTIYAAGFIREIEKNNGSKVILNNGSTLYQPFTVKDFPGGSVSYAIYQTMDGSEPITAYSRFILMNVSPETHINYGGSVKVWAMLYAASKVNQTVGDMIGYGANNTSSVIVLTDETYSKIVAKFDLDTEVCDLDIYGGAKTNGMKLKINTGLSNVTINTADALFAISYHYDVELLKAEGQESATFTMGQRFKIMTGAKFTIGEGAVVNATDIIIYEDFNDIRSDAGGDPNHPVRYPDKPAAIFTVNGTLNLDKLGGKVYSNVEGAQINIKSAAIYTAYEIDTTSGSSLTAKVDKKNSITEKAILIGETHEVSNITLNTVYTYENGEWTLWHVSFDSNGGSDCASMGVADAYLTLPTPEREGYEFLGWYYNDALISSGEAPKVAGDHTLVAKWKSENEVWVTVGLDSDGDGSADSQVQFNPAEGMVYPSLPTPTMDGYKFIGWTYNGTSVTAGSAVTADGDHMLTAQWAKLYTVSVSTSNATVSGVTNGDKVAVGETVSVTVSFSQSNSKTFTVTDASGNTLLSKSANGTYTFTMPEGDVTISASSEGSCIAAGTLVTLADGTQKKVEDLTMEDILLVFNHETGEYEPAGIIFIENDGWDYYNVITLTFSDGTTTKIIYEHALFDLTMNEYVYITEQNYADFIGHEFAMQSENGFKRVTMTDATLAVEYTGCFSLVTVYHLNYFIDGLFSIPGGISGLFNIFEYGDDLVYDAEKMQADIEEYGLFTYEDFEEILPYEFYMAFPASYLKVSIGKGMMTFDHVFAYIEQFLVQNGLM